MSGKTMINVTENYAPDDSKHAQLGRVGYLFPKPIVEAVRAKAGQRVAQLERIIHIDHNGNPLHSSVEPKTSIEIRRNIKDIFPLIPESELAMVAERAWDKVSKFPNMSSTTDSQSRSHVLVKQESYLLPYESRWPSQRTYGMFIRIMTRF